MNKENWEKIKLTFTEEERSIANLIEIAVEREYQKGKTIDRDLVRQIVINTDYNWQIYKIVDYLVNKYRT